VALAWARDQLPAINRKDIVSYIPEEEPTDEDFLRHARKVLQLCVTVNPYGSANNAEAARKVHAEAYELIEALNKRLDLPESPK